MAKAISAACFCLPSSTRVVMAFSVLKRK
jgi:hypothetical protein